jgi:hypothetical protein
VASLDGGDRGSFSDNAMNGVVGESTATEAEQEQAILGSQEAVDARGERGHADQVTRENENCDVTITRRIPAVWRDDCAHANVTPGKVVSAELDVNRFGGEVMAQGVATLVMRDDAVMRGHHQVVGDQGSGTAHVAGKPNDSVLRRRQLEGRH